MKQVQVMIEGVTPLLQHRMTEDALFGLMGSKTGKKKQKEELTPREIAERHVYQAKDKTFYLPMESVVMSIKHVASDYKQKNSARKSIKPVVAGAIRPSSETATLLDLDNKPLVDFEVDVRRGVNHQKGAIAICRPRFDRWKIKFDLTVNTDIIPLETAQEMLADAGKRSGLGSFRVSNGGYFGQFRILQWDEI